MKCPNCYAENSMGSRFCQNCGTDMNSYSNEQSESAADMGSTEQSFTQAYHYDNQQTYTGSQDQGSSPYYQQSSSQQPSQYNQGSSGGNQQGQTNYYQGGVPNSPYPVTGTQTQVAKKKSPVVPIIIAIVAVIVLGLIILFVVNALGSSGKSITNQELLDMMVDGKIVFTDYSLDLTHDLPVMSVEITEQEYDKNLAQLHVAADIVREDEYVRVSGNYDIELYWDGYKKDFTTGFAKIGEEQEATIEVLNGPSEELILESLQYSSYTIEDQYFSYGSPEDLDSFTILEESTEDLNYKVLAEMVLNGYDGAKATIKEEHIFKYSLGEWWYQYDLRRIISTVNCNLK